MQATSMANIENLSPVAYGHAGASLYQDFVIELPPNVLLQIMGYYQLKAADVAESYLASSAHLRPTQEFSEYESSLATLINEWPTKLNWPQFNQHIHQLLFAWLEDYKSGIELDTAFLTIQNLNLHGDTTLESDPNINQGKFQCLLMHLLARITSQFDQYKFNYIQHFDVETGLPNQQLMLYLLNQHLHQHLDQAPENASQDSPHIGLMLINLNINFDETADLNAHSSQLTNAAIQIVGQHLNENMTLFRVSPTELGIIIEHLHFSAQLNLIASKLTHAFETELPLEEITLILKPFFGAVNTTLETRSNATSLYDNAKLALQFAMANNRQVEIYDHQIAATFSGTRELDEAIIEALQQNELELFLQPVVTLPSETCHGSEALLRWRHPDWPSISPPRIIDTIYKKGFGQQFIRWLVNNACQRIAELEARHGRQLSININLSCADLLDADIPSLLSQAITLWQIPAESLIVEITEGDIAIDETAAEKVIAEIVLLGCKIAIDDFGTGYSSMARLRNMPADIVKIDQSFVRNIATSSQDKDIVQSIITLAHSLGKIIVAEGAEDIAAINILKEMKCEKIQGYYYSKPLSFEHFNTWLENFNPPH